MTEKTSTGATDTVAIERPAGVKTRSTFVTEAEPTIAEATASRPEAKPAGRTPASGDSAGAAARPVVPTAPTPLREQLLDEASDKITVQREADYGDAGESFDRIAALWTARDLHIGNRAYTAVDVAQMLALLKVSRLAYQPGHQDSYEDLIGYAALGGELALTEETN